MNPTAKIKEVIDNPDNPKEVTLVVEYSDGVNIVTKNHLYTSTNLNSKQEVLDMIQGELGLLTGFKAVVDEIKSEIDVPIEAVAVEGVVKNG